MICRQIASLFLSFTESFSARTQRGLFSLIKVATDQSGARVPTPDDRFTAWCRQNPDLLLWETKAEAGEYRQETLRRLADFEYSTRPARPGIFLPDGDCRIDITAIKDGWLDLSGLKLLELPPRLPPFTKLDISDNRFEVLPQEFLDSLSPQHKLIYDPDILRPATVIVIEQKTRKYLCDELGSMPRRGSAT